MNGCVDSIPKTLPIDMRIKVVSLNLWNGGRLFEPMLHFLQSQQADVMLLQEAYNGHGDHMEKRLRSAELLREHFPDHHSVFAPTYLDTRKVEGAIDDGQLLLSRFPITDHHNEFLDLPYAPYDQDTHQDFTRFPVNTQLATLRVGKQELHIIHVHGPVDFDGDHDSQRRQAWVDFILSAVAEKELAIVAGDFNAKPTNPSILRLAHVMASAFDPDTRKTSFNTNRKDLHNYPGYANAVVDMAFVSHGITVESADCPHVDISDHLPIVLELEVPDGHMFSKS